MANTSRLNLYKPSGTELCIVETSVNEQMDLIDEKALSSLVNEDEPIADFIGQEWWNPDTKKFYIWNGTTWFEIDLTTVSGPPPEPSGRKGFTVATNNTNSNTISSGENTTPFIPVTFTATSGRKYEITGCVNIVSPSGNNVKGTMNIRVGSGSTVTNSGTLIHRTPAGRADPFETGFSFGGFVSFVAHWIAPSTGTFTAGLFLRRLSGTDSIAFKANNYHALAVEEVGE